MIHRMAKKAPAEIEVPSTHDWRTTDEDEINRRRLRAQTEDFRIGNSDSRHPIFSNFRVQSGSGLTYSVEIREVAQRQFACECVDFRINGPEPGSLEDTLLPPLSPCWRETLPLLREFTIDAAR